jgi:hypothetical protein
MKKPTKKAAATTKKTPSRKQPAKKMKKPTSKRYYCHLRYRAGHTSGKHRHRVSPRLMCALSAVNGASAPTNRRHVSLTLSAHHWAR